MNDEQKEIIDDKLVRLAEAVARRHCELLQLGISPDEVIDEIAETYVRVLAEQIDDTIIKIHIGRRDTEGKVHGSASVKGVTGHISIDVARGFLRALDRHLKEMDRNPR